MSLTAPTVALASFEYAPRTRVVFGSGTLNRLGEIARPYGRKVLVVTDRGLAEAGHQQHAVEILERAGCRATIFADVTPNPTTADVDRCLAVAQQADPDVIVGLGGGSSMDCAKGTGFLLAGGGRMADYKGVGRAKGTMRPFIAVPTTAGTGSEAQSFAVIADEKTHMKMACGDPQAAARVAILDPELTLTMPPYIAAVTGIDAITHAIETYVTKKRSPLSQMFSREAWSQLSNSFTTSLQSPMDVEARGGMLFGAHLAGTAIENSMLGAAHALANPLTAHFNTTHGVAVGVMLPHVIRFNTELVGPLYGELAEAAELCSRQDDRAAEELARTVVEYLELAELPTTLRQCDVDPQRFGQMAEEAAAQWTGTFNPRPLSVDDFRSLYQAAYDGEAP